MRYIGIRHRVKKLAKGESSPTQICIVDGDQVVRYDLETEGDELNWLRGIYATSWRKALPEADADVIEQHLHGKLENNVRWRKLRTTDDPDKCVTRKVGNKGRVEVMELPESLDGFQDGDVIGMSLGGSGDRLAFALSNRAERMDGNTVVMRIKPADLKQWREEYYQREKDDDALTLAEMVRDNTDSFLVTCSRDRDLIALKEAWRNREDARKARIAAEQRLRSHLIGRIFCSEEGHYPEGSMEIFYEEQRDNDKIIQALIKEQKARETELKKILQKLEVYIQLFKPITGVGPMISTRIIVAVGDIRRFPTAAKLKAFLGAHVMRGGRFGDREVNKQFPRRRTGELANWHPDGRQALYLLSDQCNRRPSSEWGQKLLHYKEKLRTKHPHVMCSACNTPWEQCSKEKRVKHTQRYSDGHILKMARWRTINVFVKWLWQEWTKLEKAAIAEEAKKAA